MATATRTKHSKLDHVSMTPGLTVIHPDPDQARKSSSDDLKVDIIAVPGLGAIHNSREPLTKLTGFEMETCSIAQSKRQES